MQDLLGGLIDFAFVPYQSTYPDLVRQGRLKVIGSLSNDPLPPPFQAVQKSSESGLRDFQYDIWTAYVVKKGTPKGIQQRLNEAITTSLRDPQARKQLESQAKVIFEPMNVEGSANFYAREIARYRALVKAAGVEAQ